MHGTTWFQSSSGAFSGSDSTAGHWTSTGISMSSVRVGDFLWKTDTAKVYECIALAGESYGGSTLSSPLWAYRATMRGPQGVQGTPGTDGTQGPAGPMSTFVPAAGLSNAVNQGSIWLEADDEFVFPAPSPGDGQLLEYVLYVKAAAAITFSSAAAVFADLVAAGYTVYRFNESLLEGLALGSLTAFTVSQMGDSMNVLVTKAALDPTAVAAPAQAQE